MLGACGLRYEPPSSVPAAVLAACNRASALPWDLYTLLYVTLGVVFVTATEEPPVYNHGKGNWKQTQSPSISLGFESNWFVVVGAMAQLFKC